MRIASIIIPIVSTFLYLILLLIGSYSEKKAYDVRTYFPRFLIRISRYILPIVSIVFSIVFALFMNLTPLKSDSFMLIVLGVFFPLMGLLLVFVSYGEYAAIKGDTIYVRRYILTKKFKVSDVISVDIKNAGLVFKLVGGKTFSVNLFSEGIELFIEYIKEKAINLK